MTSVQSSPFRAWINLPIFLLGAVPICRMVGFVLLKGLSFLRKDSEIATGTTTILSGSHGTYFRISLFVAEEIAVTYRHLFTGSVSQKSFNINCLIPVEACT